VQFSGFPIAARNANALRAIKVALRTVGGTRVSEVITVAFVAH
jgi:hypothetical protein